MVACRPPSGTSVPPRLATPRPQPQRPHSSIPPRWQPRSDGDPHAAHQRTDQARARRLARTDPNAASEQSSQPPLSRCCDDHLNPSEPKLMAGLLADGLNLGLTRLAEACSIASLGQLASTSD